ncbi:hypothetical protein C8K30_1221, partial [Promicromonospora sp. AC04]
MPEELSTDFRSYSQTIRMFETMVSLNNDEASRQ